MGWIKGSCFLLRGGDVGFWRRIKKIGIFVDFEDEMGNQMILILVLNKDSFVDVEDEI